MAGIYQSRVFNFIGGHTNRVKQSLAQGWRQVKVSVQWTGQILLAPLRWLERFSQNPERQMTGGSERRPLPMGRAGASPPVASRTPPPPDRLNAASANRAIEHLLAEVVAAGHGLPRSAALTRSTYEDWSVIDEHDWDTTLLDESNLALAGTSATPLQPARPVIQGLATLLANGHLVLIDQHNQVLDVLSPSQQLHLRQQIDPTSSPALPTAATQLPGSTSSQLPATDSTNLPDRIILPPRPEIPQTLWQKINYWGKFYLEYWRVDEGASSPNIPPLLLPSSFKLPFPFQKSLAVTPQAIVPLAPTTPPAASDVTMTAGQNPEVSAITTNTNLTINVASQRQPVSTKSRQQPESQVTFQPPWIDAPTEDLGYERSLWQQFWAWLDRLALVIENWIIGIYQRLKGEN